MRTNGTRVLGFGSSATGVPMANHGFSWLGVAAGRKKWFVTPAMTRKPKEPTCYPHGNENSGEMAGATTVIQETGDIVILPAGIWHATCNLDRWTIGIGAQDSCGVYRCEQYNFCVDENSPEYDICIRTPNATRERQAPGSRKNNSLNVYN